MAKGGRRSTTWRLGQSGNPTGRPTRTETIEARKTIVDVKQAAREHTQDALDTLKAVMTDAKAPAAARVSAAAAVLDRGWGKPMHPIDAQISVFDRMTEGEQRALLAALSALEGEQDGGSLGNPATPN